MKALVLLLIILPNTTGCGLYVLHNALERNADNKDRYEQHRHQERMKELELQEKRDKMRQTPTNGEIVRNNPF